MCYKKCLRLDIWESEFCCIFSILKFANLLKFYVQTVITLINHEIGASGVVSQECKSVVSVYGKTILEMLLSEVSEALIPLTDSQF